MRTRYGVSPWIHNFPDSRRPDYPRFRSEHDADVAVVGGGLTGCAAAQACAASGLKTVVVEAGRIGQASAGRSAGLLLPDPGPDFREVAKAHGLRAARRIFETWRRASLDAASQLRRLGIKCGLDPMEALIVATNDDEKMLRREYDARIEAGLPVSWVARRAVTQATALDAAAAIRMRDGFAHDPYRACVGLAAAAKRRGAIFFERSAVKRVTPGSKGVELAVEGGLIRARTVIITTGTATAEFKPLRRHFKRREAYLVLTEPMPAAMRRQVGSGEMTLRDTRSPRHRLRWTDDARILVGGADQDETSPAKRDAVLVQRTGQLMYELLTMYPAISGLRPEYGWALSYGDTADGVMYIGAHRNYPRHLFALGGRGDSVTGAFLAARVLVRAAHDAPEKGDDVFGWTR